MEKVKNGTIWFFTVALAAGIGYSGIAKFLDPDGWGRRFEIFGVSSDLLFITAVFEVLGALLLLYPLTASYGGFIILVIMSVAVWAHLTSGVGDPSTAAIYGLVAAVLVWVRRVRAWRPGAAEESAADP
ncbi:MAG: DoxX family protein [Pseudomonadales bacterium]|nr:DoxX family protein [Pseudomonadales bacterium]